MTDFAPERRHPLGLIDNPEWRKTEAVRAELYLEERARREAEKAEHWFRPSFVTAALAGVAVATALVSYMVGALLG